MAQLYGQLGAYDAEGIFIGDGSYLFVPDNKNYAGSKRLLCDEHNHPVSKDEEANTFVGAVGRDYYTLRTDIEERHRQVKCFWDLTRFPSTAWSLIVSQTVFVARLNRSPSRSELVSFSSARNIEGDLPPTFPECDPIRPLLGLK